MRVRLAAAGAGVGIAAAGAPAQTVYRGYDPNPGFGVPSPPFASSDAARGAFAAGLTGIAVQDFESFPLGAMSAAVTIGPVAATFTSLGNFGTTVRNQPLFDTFATSGEKFVYAEVAEGTPYWRFTFASPIRAVGFTHTDASDWTGISGVPSLVAILDAGTASERSYDLVTIDTSLIPSGSVGFFGVIADELFSTLTVFRPAGGGNTDALGIDDLTVEVPGPGTLGVLALAGAAAVRRRRRG